MGTLGPLLLLPAFGGYLFLIRCDATRDSTQVATGYHVVFQSAVAGVFLLAICRPLAVCLRGVLPEGMIVLWDSVFPIAYAGTAALTVVLGSISPLLVNPFVNRMAARRPTAERTSDRVGLTIVGNRTQTHEWPWLLAEAWGATPRQASGCCIGRRLDREVHNAISVEFP